MRTVLRGLLALAAATALLTPVALALALWLALEPAPRVAVAGAPDVDALQQARALLRAHDPRRGPAGRLRVLTLTAAELSLLAGQGARLAGGAAELRLGPGTLQARLSLPAPPNPVGGWLNLSLRLEEGPALPALHGLKVGRLPLPAWLAAPLLERALAHWDPGAGALPPLREVVRAVRLQPQRLQLVYVTRPDLLQRLAGRLLPPAQRARLRAHHERLAATLGAAPGPLPLPQLMAPLFALAAERSAAGADPAAENRAALVTLALYVTGRSAAGLLRDAAGGPDTPASSGARAWPRLRWRPVLLLDRVDFPQHLLVSAALAAAGDGPLADALGLAKEVSDAHDGSGFSFNDLAVNRAGARLGELAVREPRRLQTRLAAGIDERALVPRVADLPEFLPEAAFRARYGGVGAPAYERLLAEIDARVAALPLLP